MDGLVITVDASLENDELNSLFARSWPTHHRRDFGPVLARSLVHVSARLDGRLIGFANVATDGGEHAFLLDPTVAPEFRRQGIGRALVHRAIAESRRRGALWLHVDYAVELEPFYRSAGFQATAAGLVRLDAADAIGTVTSHPDMSSSLSTVLARETARVSARAAELFERNASLSLVERNELHGLWDYGKRLAFINVFLALAQPAPMSPTDLGTIAAAFRSAVAKHGSATHDNLAAISLVHLAHDERERVSLRLGPLGQPLGDLLCDLVDVVGTAEFFSNHLAGLPELQRLSPELWESAYRILMLTADALFTCPRHSSS